jgi:hypothetical protein
MGKFPDLVARFLRWFFSPYTESRRRRQFVVAAAGSFMAAAGLLAIGLLLPEMPFAGAPTTLIEDAGPGDLVKVYGRINCSCLIAVDWFEEQVGLGLYDTHVTIDPFTLQDPSGTVYVDADSVAIVKPGRHTGQYWKDDFAAVYGHIYDQGGGVMAIRAQVVAPEVDASLARFAWAYALFAGVGAVLVAAALADRLVFGHVSA